MILTIDIKHLAKVLTKTFPDIEETKLKSALFDLLLELEEGSDSSVDLKTKENVLKKTAPTVNASEDTEDDVSDVTDTEEEVKVSAPQALIEDSSWASLANSPKKNFEVEDAFALDEDGTTATEEHRPPTTATRAKTRKARKRPMEEFEGLSDLEIARLLTEQQAGKQKRENGQFVDLGVTDSGKLNVNDDELVFE